MTLGSHGDTMVPLPGRATIAGTPAEEVLDRETLAGAFQRTRAGGAEIVALLQRGSAYYAPASATNAMVRAVLEDRHEVHPVCSYLTGQYGIDDVFVGVPAVLSRRGVESVRELELSPAELADLRAAAEAVRAKCAELDEALGLDAVVDLTPGRARTTRGRAAGCRRSRSAAGSRWRA